MRRPWCGRCATRGPEPPAGYLDASVIVPLFAADALAERARAWRRGWKGPLIISDLALTECAVIAWKLRTGALRRGEAEAALNAVRAWSRARTVPAAIAPEDIAQARAWIRRLDLPQRAPDVIHLAAARRPGAALVTFDAALAAAAGALGLSLAPA